ncbi:hypothetical protein CIB48_g4558 [Xylaria polymorpha]|nr:hypothetical protein CIB48_g4558 [Xylaria polymorpha]
MEFDTGYWCTPAHVIAAAVGLTILDITFVTLRFAARKKQRQTLKVDDWIVIPVTLFTLGISICMVYGVSQKAIAYPYEIPPEAEGNALLVTTRQISLAGQIWQLNLKLTKKIAITAVFLLGAVTVAVSLLRLVITARLVVFGFDPNTNVGLDNGYP